jgi:hypothetical protein
MSHSEDFAINRQDIKDLNLTKCKQIRETLSLSHVVPANYNPMLVHCCLLGSFVLLLRHHAGHRAIHDKQLEGQLGTPHLHWFICGPELSHDT